MSIVDASIFQMRELYEIEGKYRYCEDMWLSYLVHAAEWAPIQRLFLLFDYDFVSSGTGQWKAGPMKNLKADFLHQELQDLRCRGQLPTSHGQQQQQS